MLIDLEKCVGCGKCTPYCPMNAIVQHKKDKNAGRKAYSEIDSNECVECQVCLRAGICATDAIVEEDLVYPRLLRRAFSDPLYIHKGTDIPGRGTEEMKTNDVTGRFKDGWIGIGMEFGRPGVGTRLSEPEKAFKKLRNLGIEFEPNNPLTQLIANTETAELKPEVVGEKVLSAIVEFTIRRERAQEVFTVVKEVAEEIDTVFSLDLICKVASDGGLPILKELEISGLKESPNGKVNVGLGRPYWKG